MRDNLLDLTPLMIFLIVAVSLNLLFKTFDKPSSVEKACIYHAINHSSGSVELKKMLEVCQDET